MTDHPTPGSPLSADDVGLLKRGDVLEYIGNRLAPAGTLMTITETDENGIDVIDRGESNSFFYATLTSGSFRLSLPTDRRTKADTPPSAGPDAGLVSELRSLSALEPGWYANVGKKTGERCCKVMSSAAAALEAAAEREGELRQELSEMDALRKFIFSALLNAGVMVAPGEEPGAVRRLSDRATRAEAQVADRDKRIAELEGLLATLEAERKREDVRACHLKRAIAVAYATAHKDASK